MKTNAILKAIRSGPSTVWFVFGIGGLVMPLVLASAIFLQYRGSIERIRSNVRLWEPELARAFATDDGGAIQRIGKTLATADFDALTIFKDHEAVFKLPADQASDSCMGQVSIPIARYGAALGQITLCPGVAAMVVRLITSPLSLGLSMTVGILAALLSMIPLLRYRLGMKRLIQELRSWAGSQRDSGNPAEIHARSGDPLLRELTEWVTEGVDRRIEAERLTSKLKTSESLSKLATQVAHDIRSPLVALDNMLGSLKSLPEDERVLIRTSVNRIKDIANNLVEKNREISFGAEKGGISRADRANEATNETVSTQLLSSLIDPLISEKRLQFRAKIGVLIDSGLDATSYGLFAKIQPTEFKRVVSNLVNNAVEILGDHGKVTVSLTRVLGPAQENQIELRVTDDGKGIPPEILAKLGQRGETHGKEGGSGLGLYHARTSVEHWGGKLNIESTVGKGTSVIIQLPLADPPHWFVSELKLRPGTPVVILDDDSSIHGIWQSRMDLIKVKDHGVEVVHLSTPTEFRQWVQTHPKAKEAQYLCDFELLGFKESGLDLIEQLALGSRSILVTSRFEEPQIRSGCEKLRVRLIPKGMAGLVPIKLEAAPATQSKAVILIDDDSLVHMTWKMTAKKAGYQIFGYTRFEDFMAAAPGLDRGLTVFIDSFLGEDAQGNKIMGEFVSKQIFDLGFKKIFLASGLPPDNLKPYPWLSGATGKEPPFGNPELLGD